MGSKFWDKKFKIMICGILYKNYYKCLNLPPLGNLLSMIFYANYNRNSLIKYY